MSDELKRWLCTFVSFDGSRSQNTIVGHSIHDAITATELNPNCKTVISVSLIQDLGPKVKQRSGWISDTLPVRNQLLETLERLHRP
jgi:hypothetical protein